MYKSCYHQSSLNIQLKWVNSLDETRCTHTYTHTVSRALSHTHEQSRTDQERSINSNERIAVRGISGSDSGRKTGGVHPVSVPTCHLRPIPAELMRGLGPHAQPWDRAPTLPPAGVHHTGTLIWKTWHRQGGLLCTCWAETPLTVNVQGHAGCLFGHSFIDEVCVCTFVFRWCINKRRWFWKWSKYNEAL